MPQVKLLTFLNLCYLIPLLLPATFRLYLVLKSSFFNGEADNFFQ